MPEKVFNAMGVTPRSTPPSVDELEPLRDAMEKRGMDAEGWVVIQGVKPWRTIELSVSNDWDLYVDVGYERSHYWPEGQTWVMRDDNGHAIPWSDMPGVDGPR